MWFKRLVKSLWLCAFVCLPLVKNRYCYLHCPHFLHMFKRVRKVYVRLVGLCDFLVYCP